MILRKNFLSLSKKAQKNRVKLKCQNQIAYIRSLRTQEKIIEEQQDSSLNNAENYPCAGSRDLNISSSTSSSSFSSPQNNYDNPLPRHNDQQFVNNFIILNEDQLTGNNDQSGSHTFEDLEDDNENDASHDGHDPQLPNLRDERDEYAEDIQDFLRSWYFSNRVRISQLDALLEGLRHYGRTNVPKLGRTLLGTPRSNKIVPLKPGEYGHYGLQKALVYHIESSNQGTMPRFVEICLYTNGFPTFSKEAWSILGRKSLRI